jgi:hypothetical protein
MAEEFPVDAHVCVVGRGTSSGVHEHSFVVRLTKTMIVLENGRRYQREERLHSSIPYSPYEGTKINRTCQRPFKSVAD